MKKKVKTLSVVQLERQLKTWKTKDPEEYEKILLRGQAMGVLTKTGKISRAKPRSKNQAKLQAESFEKFEEQYRSEFGSYTRAQKRWKQRMERYNEYAIDPFKSVAKYKEFRKVVNEIYQDIYDLFLSDEYNAIFENVDSMDREAGMAYMREEIRKKRADKDYSPIPQDKITDYSSDDLRSIYPDD